MISTLTKTITKLQFCFSHGADAQQSSVAVDFGRLGRWERLALGAELCGAAPRGAGAAGLETTGGVQQGQAQVAKAQNVLVMLKHAITI